MLQGLALLATWQTRESLSPQPASGDISERFSRDIKLLWRSGTDALLSGATAPEVAGSIPVLATFLFSLPHLISPLSLRFCCLFLLVPFPVGMF